MRVAPGSVSPTAAITSATPRNSWNQRVSIAFICSAIAGGGERNSQPCARNASASNTWTTQSRIFTLQIYHSTHFPIGDGGEIAGYLRFQGSPSAELAEDCFEHGQQRAGAPGANHHIPERLELLPSRRISEVAQAGDEVAVCRCAARDRTPPVKLAVRPSVAMLELRAGHPCGLKHRMPGVIEIPIVGSETALLGHPAVQRGRRIRREYVECRGLDSLLNRPLDGALEHARGI